MKTIALIGCGALSHIFARNLLRILPGEFRITGVMARHAGSAESFAETLDCRFFTEIDPLLALKPDFVIEFAGGAAVREYGEAILRSGANFIPASVGALADPKFFNTLKTAAKESGAKLFIPSGAIGGLDLMQVYALKGDARVEIEDVKAPRSLEGAPGLKGRIPSATAEEVLFTGTVRDAIAAFPKNVNVAVTASVAAEAPNARVTVRSVPGLRENIHRISLSNGLMHAELSIASKPDPANPKSSTSAAWSVIALLRNLVSDVVFF